MYKLHQERGHQIIETIINMKIEDNNKTIDKEIIIQISIKEKIIIEEARSKTINKIKETIDDLYKYRYTISYLFIYLYLFIILF